MNEESLLLIPSGGMTDVGDRNNHHLIYRGNSYGLDNGQSIPAEGEEFTPSIHLPDNSWIWRADLRPVTTFASHGHLDHIGGLPWFNDDCGFRMKRNYPSILGSEYTLKVVDLVAQSQVEEDDVYLDNDATDNGVPVVPGESKQVEDAHFAFFSVPHSIPGSMGTVVTLGGKRIAYLGDTKLNGYSPEETRTYKNALSSLESVDYLLLDSTGVGREGSTPSDSVSVEEVRRIVNANPWGRLFITGFSSHTGRLTRIMKNVRADHPERQVVVAGKSLYRHLEVAGLHSGRDYTSYSWPFEANISENAVIFLTGSNGEEFSAMDRMMKGDLNGLRPAESDAVVFAASTIPVPDNQKAVTQLLQKLERTEADIHISPDVYVDPSLNGGFHVSQCHTSGHAFQDDLREIVELVNPKAIIPVHADRQRREIMRELFPERDVRLVDTGQALEL